MSPDIRLSAAMHWQHANMKQWSANCGANAKSALALLAGGLMSVRYLGCGYSTQPSTRVPGYWQKFQGPLPAAASASNRSAKPGLGLLAAGTYARTAGLL